MLPVLLAAGALGGFIAGLVGVGGGVIFGPVLFFAYQAAGVEDPVLTPLTLGSSLLCTFAAASSGAVAQLKAGAVDKRVALTAGGFATIAVVLVGRFVATQPWYDKRAFQITLSVLLLAVVVRMIRGRNQPNAIEGVEPRQSILGLAATGGAAGTVAALAGVGGGVVLVPLFNGLIRLPMRVASGTSLASIVLITIAGVITYAVLGQGAPVPDGALGYVGWRSAAALALPAVVTARLGVATSHRINVRAVRLSFAAFAFVVAVRLIWNVLS
ncbi:MAG: sulfite exporter TauE/SafE family protein [Bacteroidota bacterium]